MAGEYLETPGHREEVATAEWCCNEQKIHQQLMNSNLNFSDPGSNSSQRSSSGHSSCGSQVGTEIQQELGGKHRLRTAHPAYLFDLTRNREGAVNSKGRNRGSEDLTAQTLSSAR